MYKAQSQGNKNILLFFINNNYLSFFQRVTIYRAPKKQFLTSNPRKIFTKYIKIVEIVKSNKSQIRVYCLKNILLSHNIMVIKIVITVITLMITVLHMICLYDYDSYLHGLLKAIL